MRICAIFLLFVVQQGKDDSISSKSVVGKNYEHPQRRGGTSGILMLNLIPAAQPLIAYKVGSRDRILFNTVL
jgi:hypothetical protein